MKKINVSVVVPYIDEEYNILLPINLDGKDAITLIQNTVFELSNEVYIVKDKCFLIDCYSGNIINSNNIIKFSGLKNGSRVLLV